MARSIKTTNGKRIVLLHEILNSYHVCGRTVLSCVNFLFCITSLICGIPIFAQAPGSVSGVEIWAYPQATTNDWDSIYALQDVSGDNTKLMSMSSNNATEFKQHRNAMQSFNFHPSLHIDGTDCAQLRISHSNLSQATIIGVFAPDTTKTYNDSILYLISGKAEQNIVDSIAATDRQVLSNNGVSLTHKYLESIDGQPAIKILSFLRATKPQHSVWGDQNHSFLYLGGHNDSFHGYLSELLVYGRELSLFERAKAESYLAIKYGLTLHGSYFAPDNTLLWDFSGDSDYHHRVTAIARYDESLLNQSVSASSYEQNLPSYRPENDSFYAQGCYNKPSANRLLVVGREGGISMPNNSYMIFGDNDGGLTLQEKDEDDLWHSIDRLWKIKSNLPSESGDTIEVLTNNINVTTIKSGLYALSRNDQSSSSYIKYGPKTSENFHFGFVVPMSMPTFDVGIVTGNGTAIEFGYRFDSSGTIYIIKNKSIKNSIYSDAFAHQIDIYKKGDDLFLQIDGIGDATYNIIVPVAKSIIVPRDIDPSITPINGDGGTTDTNGLPSISDNLIDLEATAYMSGYSCNGMITINSGGAFDLNSLRVDGFRDTGNQLEISYAIANDLSQYRKNRTVLSVLKEDDDLFENGTLYPNSGYDISRHKLIFHNVFFEPNSEQYFTFGAYDGLIADFTPTSATCNNGKSLSDGSLRIDIKCGSPLYKCVMTPIAHHVDNVNNISDDLITDDILPKYMTGLIFGVDHYTIGGLSAGEYHLTLTQLGGTNIYACAHPSNTKRSFISQIPTNPSQPNSYGVLWQVTDTVSNYQAGLVSSNNSSISDGLKLDGSKCYYLDNGESKILKDGIEPGDTLLIVNTGNNIFLRCGTSSTQISKSAPLSTFTFKTVFREGEATLANLKYLNSDTPLDGNASDESILIERVKPHSISRTIIIGCNPDSSYVEDVSKVETIMKTPSKTNGNGLHINPINLDGSDQSHGVFNVIGLGASSYKATLINETDGPTQLLVFDAIGRLVYECYMTSNGAIKEASFTLQSQGVYVIKAISESEDYSYKLLNQ